MFFLSRAPIHGLADRSNPHCYYFQASRWHEYLKALEYPQALDQRRRAWHSRQTSASNALSNEPAARERTFGAREAGQYTRATFHLYMRRVPMIINAERLCGACGTECGAARAARRSHRAPWAEWSPLSIYSAKHVTPRWVSPSLTTKSTPHLTIGIEQRVISYLATLTKL